MLDIIPYVCVTVNAHVLLFKPRVGTNMGARPAARRMRRKPSAFWPAVSRAPRPVGASRARPTLRAARLSSVHRSYAPLRVPLLLTAQPPVAAPQSEG